MVIKIIKIPIQDPNMSRLAPLVREECINLIEISGTRGGGMTNEYSRRVLRTACWSDISAFVFILCLRLYGERSPTDFFFGAGISCSFTRFKLLCDTDPSSFFCQS